MAIVPSFSPSGWVSNPLEQIDFLMSYFFETQPAQSHFHKRVIKSYQTLIANTPSFGQLSTEIENALLDELQRVFQNVQVNCSVVGAFDQPDNSELTIQIGCSFDAQGRRYNIDHAIEMLGTQVKKLNRINETGSE